MDNNGNGKDEQTKLLDQVERAETAGMSVTRQWYDLWSEAMRYFFSDQDYKLGAHEDWDWVIVNYIWPCAMQEIAKLAKNHPKIIALPFNSGEQAEIDAAEVWQGATQWQWQERLNMRLNQIAAIFCGKIFGYIVSYVYWEDKVEWDDKNKRWLGDVRYKLWNPAFFWADGDEEINEGNCGTVRWAELTWMQSRWPQFKDELEKLSVSLRGAAGGEGSDANLSSWMSAGTLNQSEDSAKIKNKPELAKIISLIKRDFTHDAGSAGDTRYVRLSNTFLKNYDEVHRVEATNVTVEELIREGTVYQGPDQRIYDATTNQPYNPGPQWPSRISREWDEPLYPHGRNVLSAGEGGSRIILADERWAYKAWPFVVVPHYLLPFMWQGLNAVSLYKTAQDMVNISISNLFNNFKQFGDPLIAVEDGALALDKDKKPYPIRSRAGSILRLLKGGLSKFRREPPMPVSPAAMAMYELWVQEFKNLSGLQAIGRGEQMRAGTTATEAQITAISSNDRIYLQSVYQDEWIKQLSKLIAEIMQQNYDVGRWLRIVGEGMIAGVTQITEKLKTVEYDITVMPGTTLPFDEEKRATKSLKAYELLQNPVANPMLPYVLMVLDIPQREKLLKEMPAYQQYLGIVKLYNQVKEGKMAPEQAVQIILQEAAKMYGAQPAGPPPMRGPDVAGSNVVQGRGGQA